MALVIKTSKVKAPEGAQLLYRDALVSEGSLLLADFSNRGTLLDFSLTDRNPVKDLSRDVSEKLGIDNSVLFRSNNPSLELTEGYGLTFDQLGGNPGSADNLGIDYGTDLLNYLSSKTSGILVTFWARIQEGITQGGGIVSSTGDGGGNNFPLRIAVTITESTKRATLSVAGTPYHVDGLDNISQISVEYRGSGLNNRTFLNGFETGVTSDPAAEFGTPLSSLVIGKPDQTNRAGVIYRYLIEDLDISGRSADSVVKKDWEYCTGTGEYEGLPTKRPFIDTL